MRLDRLLASLAIGSRQEVKAYIRLGRVSVNGKVMTDSAFQVPQGSAIHMDGMALDTRLRRHVMMHKPRGVLTAARDSRQPTVLDLLPPLYRSLGCMPVGRLDKDTEGLLLFTTDGSAAHRLLAPKNGVTKVYEARVSGCLTLSSQQRFAEGIALSDFTTLPARLDLIDCGPEESLALAYVQEGKFHQVRRMFGACGHEVLILRRLRFGSLTLDSALQPGQWRELSETAWQSLFQDTRDIYEAS